mgnify:CR=1 FL=1
MKLADFPPIKQYRSVPERYYVPYPDCVYEEAVDYLIELAEATEDYSMERMLVSYKRINNIITSIRSIIILCKDFSFLDIISLSFRNPLMRFQKEKHLIFQTYPD